MVFMPENWDIRTDTKKPLIISAAFCVGTRGGSYLLAQDGGDNAMLEFLFFGVSGGHACVFPASSGLQLGHCRFVLDKGLGCADPEAVA